MSNDRNTESALGELGDELKLQAWLASREVSQPSLKSDEAHQEASALARMRDELRVQLHLGQLEAKDEWDKLETRWVSFMKNDVGRAASELSEGAETIAKTFLQEIRDGYQRLLHS